MNAEQRKVQGQKQLRRAKRFEAAYFPAMLRVMRGQVNMFLRIMKSQGIAAATSYKYPTDGITKVITSIYRDVGAFWYRKTDREIRQSIEQKAGFGLSEEMIKQVIEYLTANILVKVNNIQQTTIDEMLAVIKEGYAKGWGVDKMAFEIESRNMPLYRARRIVRTELQFAMNAGQQKAKEDSEFETVDEWIAADDFRTRPSHNKADGQQVKGGTKFQVAKMKKNVIIGWDMMTGPGDPTASAGNVVNCRCTKAVRAARDTNGRLIRKRKIFVALPGEFNRQRQTVTV